MLTPLPFFSHHVYRNFPSGLSFFTSARGHGNNNTQTPTFGVADMTKGNVLTHLTLSPIQYKSTLSTIETSAKDTAAAAAAAAAAKDIGKECGGDDTTPTWQIVDLRSMDGGFFIAEVGRFSRDTPHFLPFLYYVTSYGYILLHYDQWMEDSLSQM